MENNLNMNTNTSLNNDNTQTKAPVLKPILSIRNLTKKYKDRYVVIDASKSLDEVVETTYKIIKEKLDGLR